MEKAVISIGEQKTSEYSISTRNLYFHINMTRSEFLVPHLGLFYVEHQPLAMGLWPLSVQTSPVGRLCGESHSLYQKLTPGSPCSLFERITELNKD